MSRTRVALSIVFMLVAAAPSSARTVSGSGTKYAFSMKIDRCAATIEMTRARIADLDRALSQVVAGDYGRCETCGDEIGGERLAARPSARTCIRCAT